MSKRHRNRLHESRTTQRARIRGRCADFIDPLSVGATRHEVLPVAESSALALAAQGGDTAARERLLLHNQRLVALIAIKHRNQGCDVDDLVSVGNMGLLTAIDTFKDDKNAVFGTWAHTWITSKILRELQEHSRTISVPSHRQKNYAERKAVTIRCASLDAPVGPKHKGEGTTLGGMIGTRDRASDSRHEDLAWRVRRLPGRARRVLELRYGLDGGGARDLAEVAEELRASRMDVRQIEANALRRMGAFGAVGAPRAPRPAPRAPRPAPSAETVAQRWAAIEAAARKRERPRASDRS